MFCRKCGVELRAGAMFCHKCGHPAPAPDGRVPRPSSSAAPSSEAHHAPGLINTMPKQEERSSGGQFEEWFSDAGDL